MPQIGAYCNKAISGGHVSMKQDNTRFHAIILP